MPPQLPAGFTSRPPTQDDLPLAADLFNACSRQMIGAEEFNPSDIQTEWTTPGLNAETDQHLVFSPDGRLAGYVEVWTLGETPVYPSVWGRVHPDFEGLGIGSALLAWAEARARQVLEQVPADARVAFRCGTIDTHTPSNQLLQDFDMSLIRHSYQMRIAMDAAPPEPIWPQGIQVRNYQDGDIKAVYEADDEAFQDHFGYVPEDPEASLARFSHFFLEDEGFDPDLWFLAMDGNQVAAVCLCRTHSWEDPTMGWVSSLGVRRPWRKQGLGLALLQHAFGVYWRRGLKSVGLGVDGLNLTGALRLYERAGMHAYRTYHRYEKEIRPGRELSTT